MTSTAETPEPEHSPRRSMYASVVSFARQLAPREPIDNAFDWIRFKIDSPGSLAYQPVAGTSAKRLSGGRGEGTTSRWNAMLPVAEECGATTAVDIGCNLGWFAINLGLRGIRSIGVEGHPPAYRSATYLARKSGAENVSILAMSVTAENASLVPHADAMLCLSVWHHFVRHQGMPAADTILSQLWTSTQKVLFFETGEVDMPPVYKLPEMTPNPRQWITDYLEQRCPGGEVRHLGLHESAPTYSRNLFAVLRK